MTRILILNNGIMSRKQITKRRVREIIADVLTIEVKDVKDNSRLVEDLDADSIDAVEIALAIEQETDIEIDDIPDWVKTVTDIYKLANAIDDN